jgi:hypothetical protein
MEQSKARGLGVKQVETEPWVNGSCDSAPTLAMKADRWSYGHGATKLGLHGGSTRPGHTGTGRLSITRATYRCNFFFFSLSSLVLVVIHHPSYPSHLKIRGWLTFASLPL